MRLTAYDIWQMYAEAMAQQRIDVGTWDEVEEPERKAYEAMSEKLQELDVED